MRFEVGDSKFLRDHLYGYDDSYESVSEYVIIDNYTKGIKTLQLMDELNDKRIIPVLVQSLVKNLERSSIEDVPFSIAYVAHKL
jgi:hypothetical protein